MSYQEKRAIISMTSGLLVFIVYTFYLYETYPERMFNPEVDFKFWGSAFLIMIPVSIVVRIIIHIIFSIINKIATDEDDPGTDERDKMVELLATRNGFFIFGMGYLAAMATLTSDTIPHYTMFIVMICSGMLSEIVEGISKLYLYRRGF